MHLALFFTRGMSLSAWDDIGMLEREAALYRRLRQKGADISFVTYGDSRDLQYGERIPGVRILCNRLRLPNAVYTRLLPRLHGRALGQIDVVKTNQTNGADVALRAARLWSKPLIARCGYLHSEFVTREHGADSPEASDAETLESKVFLAASRVVVTTPAMREKVVTIHGIDPEKVAVVPNYVDTDRFRPSGTFPEEPPRKICFVGRLVPQKNVTALLEAVARTDLEVLLVGNGPLRTNLEQVAQRLDLRAQFLGNLANADLPGLINRCGLFALPSHYEGHPKALLEAMACGVPVIAADSPGIREVVRHGETGYLCGSSSESIQEAIETLHNDPALRARLGRAARKYVVDNFSLDRIAEQEFALIQEVISAQGPRG